MSLAINIPSFIIQRIASYLPLNVLFEDNLYLLKICRQWREALVPIVYRTVYFDGNKKCKVSIDRNKKLVYSTGTVECASINLAKQLGLTQVVRCINIQPTATGLLNYLLDNLEHVFGFANNDWSMVNEINIFNIEKAYLLNEPMDICLRKIDTLKQIFYKAMPKVNSIQIEEKSTISKVIPLGQMLLEAYSTQLKTFKARNCSIDISQTPFTTLSSLSIDCSQTRLRITKECAQNLESLELLNMPTNYDWSEIIADCADSGTVVFSTLSTLHISNDSDFEFDEIESIDISNMVTSELKLEFPAVKRLKLGMTYSHEIIRFLSCGTYNLPNVKHIEFTQRYSSDVDNNSYDREYDVREISKLFQMHLPHLTSIVSGIRKKKVDIVMQNLAYVYSERLEMLKIDSLVEFNHTINLPRLTQLSLYVESESTLELIGKTLLSLRTLHLYNVARSFDWDFLIDSGTKIFIEFLNMEDLSITFENTEFDEQQDLNSLIKCCQESETRYKIFSPKLKKIQIGGASYYNLYKLLCFEPNSCLNLRTIDITVAKFSDNLYLPVKVQFDRLMWQLGMDIASSAPHVNYISCKNDYANSKSENILYTTLYNNYSQQLKSFFCQSLVSTNDLVGSTSLEKCSLRLNSKTNFVKNVRTYPSDLKWLTLENIPRNFTWKWFASQNNIIRFPQLKIFTVENSTEMNLEVDSTEVDSSMSGEKYRKAMTHVHMPNLQTLVFSIKNNTERAMPSKIYFRELISALLEGPVGALPIRGSRTPNFSNMITIRITSACDADQEWFYHMTNSWLGKKGLSQFGSLYLKDISFDIDGERICWNGIILTIDYGIKVHTVSHLIHKAKDMSRLYIRKMDMSSIPDYVDCVDVADHRLNRVYPLSKTLKTLSVTGDFICGSEEKKNKVITYLLLALPCLTSLKLERVKFNKDEFIDRYGDYYPHVGQTKIEIV